MKPQLISRGSGRVVAAFLSTLVVHVHADPVTVEGALNNSGPEGYTLLHTQTTPSNWDTQSLANIHAKQEGGKVFLHLAGKANGNAVILFLDTKPGGVNVITNNLITSGGEEFTINSLGASATEGMAFEAGFEADYAIRIYGSGTDAHVNLYNLQTGTRVYVGNSGSANVASGIISDIRTIWTDALPADYATASLGVEMGLALSSMGFAPGAGTLKMTALLVNDNSSYGSNQVLASRAVTDDIGGGLTTLNFNTETGTQTLSFAVINNDNDGDGIPDDEDDDDDNDGLLDVVETNTGIYVSPTDTGTDPFLADTDGDGVADGEELEGALGYVSNPNIRNYESIAVPGNYTTPEWQADGTGGSSMTQAGTSLTTQYQWKLDYRFSEIRSIEYKYAANGSFDTNWGEGGLGGGNYSTVIPATGFYTFSFDNSTLAQSVQRKVFANVAAYLSAYGVSSGADTDGDGILNQNEFAANTDPTNADTDGDGVPDGTDADPLAASRNIVFSVNMNIQQQLGNFDPETDSVVVDFFTGLAGPLPDLVLTDSDEDGIWTGTLTNFQGPVAVSFGEYKFKNTRAGAPDGGYEGAIGNRTFDLGPSNTPQNLPIVYFNDVSSVGTGGYGDWATANAGGEPSSADFDGDGVKNGVEYFMGETGSSFTVNPGISGGTISWPRSAAAADATYKVWTSSDLVTWTDVTASVAEASGSITYTIPTGAAKLFIRLEVVTP